MLRSAGVQLLPQKRALPQRRKVQAWGLKGTPSAEAKCAKHAAEVRRLREPLASVGL